MRKIYALLLITAITLGNSKMFGQSQRMVLIEEGTNASCVPCANQNPGFQAMLETVDDKYIGLNYQWYFPGYDPMHEHNPVESDGRFNGYYGQNGVPTAMIDGEVPDGSYPGFNGSAYDGAPAGFSAQMIEDRYEVPSPFDVSIDYTLTPGNIEVTVTVTASQDVDENNLKLRIAVIEELISFDSPPGSTTQEEFHDVMKKFLPGMGGLDLMNSWSAGDSETFTESWVHQNVYDYEQLAVVAFVQNDSGQEVMQAAFSNDGVLESAFTNAGGLFGVTTPADICPGTNSISPSVNLRNTGSATLTSCDVTASINGVEETVNWSGSLELLEDEEIQFPEMTFEANAGEEADLLITVTNTNSEVNEEDVLNTASATLEDAPVVSTGVVVEIETDNYGNETFWKIVNSSGATVAEGGNDFVENNYNIGSGVPSSEGPDTYENNEDYEIEVPLDMSDCYTFQIFDYYGDGVCCSYGTGSYAVRDLQTNQLLISGGDFAGIEDGKFASSVTSISEYELNATLSIFPNPVVNNATVQANFNESAEVTIEVYDLTGKVVMARDFGTQSAGQFITELDMNELSNGLYLLNLQAGNASAVQKLSVNK